MLVSKKNGGEYHESSGSHRYYYGSQRGRGWRCREVGVVGPYEAIPNEKTQNESGINKGTEPPNLTEKSFPLQPSRPSKAIHEVLP